MQLRLSIRHKILLSAILVGLIPGIVTFYLIYHFGTAIMQEKQGEDFKEITKGTAREIGLILHNELSEAIDHASHWHVQEAISKANALYNSRQSSLLKQARALEADWAETAPDSIIVRNLTGHSIAEWLKRYETHKSEYLNITLIDMHGVAVASLEKPRRYFYGDDPAWRDGIRSSRGSGFISDFFPVNDGKYGMEAAVPVYATSGQTVGVLVITYDVNKVFAAINAIRVGETGHINVVREDGMMLLDPLIPPLSLKIDRSLLDLIAKPEPGWITADDEHGGINAIMGYAPVKTTMFAPGSFGGHKWYVFLGLNPEESAAPVRRLLGRLAILGILFIGLVSVFAYLVAERIIRPIKSLKVGADMIGEGKLDYRLDIRTGDEIESLANDFNIMAEKLKESRHTLIEWNAQLEEEIKRRTYDLRIANEELKRADRMKSEFLTNMSHELRTPLNSIIGFSEVLLDNLYGELNEKQQRYVSNVHLSGHHLLQLINDILDLSKVEAGKMELFYNTIALRDFLGNIITAFRTQAEKKQLTISYRVEGIEQITADLTRLKQICYNLLSNAVKFTPDHGNITVTARPHGEFTEIAVADSGIGIKKEHQHLIFEEFKQLDASFTRKYEGTGLGLALTKKLVELHGGKIWVESEEGRGSTFFILLPSREKKKSSASPETAAADNQTHAS